MKHANLIQPLLEIARKAGDIIMDYYDGDITVDTKKDESPVTEADIAANEFIVEKLRALTPNIPIVTEESDNPEIQKSDNYFWLVDPLDGTKSFIKRTGEFTVNIGLVEIISYEKEGNISRSGIPVMGVVYVPAQQEIYFTGEDGHAYRQEDGMASELISVAKPARDGLVVIASKSHISKETEEFISTLKVRKFVPAASAYKFCVVARGEADIYPRFAPTMEWDTAAGHAILLAAGGNVTNPDDTPLMYNKPDFHNGHFIAWGYR